MNLDQSREVSLNPALPPYSFRHYISWNYRLRSHNQLKTPHIPTRPKAPFTQNPITQRRKWPTRGQARTNNIDTGLYDNATKAYLAKQVSGGLTEPREASARSREISGGFIRPGGPGNPNRKARQSRRPKQAASKDIPRNPKVHNGGAKGSPKRPGSPDAWYLQWFVRVHKGCQRAR